MIMIITIYVKTVYAESIVLDGSGYYTLYYNVMSKGRHICDYYGCFNVSNGALLSNL